MLMLMMRMILITYGQVPDRLRCGTAICSSITWSNDVISSQLNTLFSLPFNTFAKNCPLVLLRPNDAFTLLLRTVPCPLLLYLFASVSLANDNIDMFSSEFHGFFVGMAHRFLYESIAVNCWLSSPSVQCSSWCEPFVMSRHLVDGRCVAPFEFGSLAYFAVDAVHVLCVRRLDHDCLYGSWPFVRGLCNVVESMLLV